MDNITVIPVRNVFCISSLRDMIVNELIIKYILICTMLIDMLDRDRGLQSPER